MSETALREYLGKVERDYRRGIATEHSYRGTLKDLLETLNGSITATNEPKRIKCGAPDYVIERGRGNNTFTIGYVEAKDAGMNLDEIERDARLNEPKTREGKQLKRYLHALDNLVFTNYLEFRWYLHGEKRAAATLSTPQAEKRLPFDREKAREVAQVLQSFLGYSVEPVRNPPELAKRMARLAHMIRDIIIDAFEQRAASAELKDLYSAFKEVLLPELTGAEFADMFAQTLAYGLFAARYNHRGAKPFNRNDAAKEIPRTNPFLRRLFGTIAGPELDDEPFAGFVDDLAQLLAMTDMEAVLADFGKHTRQEDPIVHFYETFLAQYDPRMRELRGVYYTPEPVVSYIVRSVDALLRAHFDCPEGLGDDSSISYSYVDEQGETRRATSPRVLLLDPACGTGTFLYYVIGHIRDSFRQTGSSGMWSGYVREQLLPRLFGFELLMAPYAMAHLKLGMQLAAADLPAAERATWSYDFQSDERLGIYLTNTLEEAIKRSDIMFGRFISDEANEAAKIKQTYPIMIVLGNPPYAGYSANKGAWIESLMQSYKVTISNEERQIQRLSNDYVKFFRFAQWRLERTDQGILGFITDSSYLDGILFRDMRHALLETFSDIYIFNLHGVAMRGSANSPKADQNVFDITQGVAIAMFVKKPNFKANLAQVHYAEIWGTRESKYKALLEQDVSNTIWKDITPRLPHWRFIPEGSDETYESWSSFISIIGTGEPQNDRDHRYGTGIKTRHDRFVIGWSTQDAIERVSQIAYRKETDAELIQELKLCTTAHFDIKRARLRAETDDLINHVSPINYRPFDRRYLVYLREFVCEPKAETMSHLLHTDNIAMAVLRRDRRELGTGFFVARGLIAKDLVSDLDDALVWPLYLYHNNPTTQGLWSSSKLNDQSVGRRPNLSPAFISDISGRLKMEFVADGKGDLRTTFGPEDIFHYMYAVFHSPAYRERYAEFLKIDFPRLPLTSHVELFRALCGLGERLVGLHLMEKSGPAQAMPGFPIKGDNRVEKVEYTLAADATETGKGQETERGRVWINKTQYFEGVAPDVWAFHVGGYQVCQKWLKDRKGRVLTYNDLRHYQRIVAALAETMTLMEQVDAAIDGCGGWPIE